MCVCVCLYLTNMTQPAATRGRLQSWPGAWRLDLTNPAVQVCVCACVRACVRACLCVLLTNSSAQLYQAHLMYCLVVYGGSGYGPTPGCANASVPPLVFDGLFVDNVFMDDGEAVNSRDIFGNAFVVLDQVTGKPVRRVTVVGLCVTRVLQASRWWTLAAVGRRAWCKCWLCSAGDV